MFDFHGYLEVSKEIENLPNIKENEALRRTAVSRAYYSAYNVANKYINDKGYLIPYLKDKGGHVYFWKQCDKIRQFKKVDHIVENSARLLDKRKKADYKPNDKISLIDVKQSNKIAEKLINQIDSLA